MTVDQNLVRGGVLVLDKPAGMTSHDVVMRVRRRLQTRKVGHAGTLDPDATGVLVLCVGDATRLLEYVSADDKEYLATAVLGYSTDTDDACGRLMERKSAASLTVERVTGALARFTGVIDQQVPKYSAVHIAGKRAYELARAGQAVEMPTRRVEVSKLELLDFEPGEVAKARFCVACSKGTYIRALCRDLGQALGVPAHMSDLRRTRSGSFSIEEAVQLDDWERLESPAESLSPPVEAVRGLRRVSVDASVLDRLSLGQAVNLNVGSGIVGDDHALCAGEVAIVPLGRTSTLGAIGVVTEGENGWVVRPKKVMWKREHETHAGH